MTRAPIERRRAFSPRAAIPRSAGTPLDRSTRAFMESRFGHDFGQVRIHADGEAAQLSRRADAHAYTVDRSIVFGAGKYRPGTREGDRLIAHELTHVVQQSGGGARIQRQADEEGDVEAAGEVATEMGEDEQAAALPDEDGAGVETEESSTEEEAAQAGEEEQERPVQAMAIGNGNTAASRLEQEANAAADSVLTSRPVRVTLGAATSLQRQPRGGGRRARNQRCGRDSARVAGYPATFISHIDVDVTSPNHDVTLSWSGPGAGSQPTGPFHSSPGAGCCHLDCNDRATSRTGGSRCTPKGPGTIHGHSCAMSSFPEARNVSWFGRSGIAFHFYPSVPNHPASHGCVRLGRDASRIIYDNTISNQTSVNVSGTWTRGRTCHRCGRRR